MRAAVIAALMACATSARAEPTIDDAFPPTLRFDQPFGGRIERIDIEQGELLWVKLRVSARFDTVDIPLDVPAGTRIIGMQFDRGDTPLWGVIVDREVALGRFGGVGGHALLAWSSTTFDVDHLSLRVEQVGSGTAAITLALELPAAMNLHVEPAARVRVDGKPTRAPIAVFPTADKVAGGSVGAHASLVVSDAITTGPAVFLDSGPHVTFGGSLDKAMIRRRVKAREGALRHCFELELQKHPKLAGDTDLHFTIAQDGHVFDVSVDGSLPNDAVKLCMADEVARWEFPAVFDGGDTQVNYPLVLVPLGR